MSEIRLDGKVAIVTGATGGWGAGAAYALAARGAAVVCNSRTQAKLDTFADRLNRQGGKAIGVAGDIRTLDGATRIVERAVEQFGRVDVLVNSAGVRVSDNTGADPSATLGLYGGPLLDMTEESWNLVITAELTGIFTATKAAVTQMVTQGDGGAVVSVVGTFVGAAGQSSHAAAKSGVLGAMWSWSDELRPHEITVNSVRGYVKSLLTDPSFNTDDYDFSRQRGEASVPTEPAEAGELVAWLASPAAAHVTGAYIGFDGPRVTLWDPQKPDTTVFNQPQWTAEELARTLGPIIARRPKRIAMTDLLMDLFSPADRERATSHQQPDDTD